MKCDYQNTCRALYRYEISARTGESFNDPDDHEVGEVIPDWCVSVSSSLIPCSLAASLPLCLEAYLMATAELPSSFSAVSGIVSGHIPWSAPIISHKRSMSSSARHSGGCILLIGQSWRRILPFTPLGSTSKSMRLHGSASCRLHSISRGNSTSCLLSQSNLSILG